MLRKIAGALALITAFNTMPVFATTNSPWIYPNATLKGDSMDTVPCTIRTVTGNKTIDAIFYEGKSYIPLTSFRELALNNHKVKSVSYEAPTQEEANFKIEITYSGEDNPSLVILGHPNTVNHSITDGYWYLQSIFYKGGISLGSGSFSDQSRVINRQGYLYVPLSFIRDECNIEVIWNTKGGDKSVQMTGANTIQEKVNDEDYSMGDNNWQMTLSLKDKKYVIDSRESDEKMYQVFSDYMNDLKVYNSTEILEEMNKDEFLNKMNKTFPNMSKEQTLDIVLANGFYISYINLWKISKSINESNIRDMLKDLNVTDNLMYVNLLANMLLEDADIEEYYNCLTSGSISIEGFRDLQLDPVIEMIMGRAISIVKEQNITDKEEFCSEVLYQFFKLGTEECEKELDIKLMDCNINTVDPMIPADYPNLMPGPEYKLMDYTFSVSGNTGLQDFKDAFTMIKSIIMMDTTNRFCKEGQAVPPIVEREISETFRLRVKPIVTKYDSRMNNATTENMASLWKDFYDEMKVYDSLATDITETYLSSDENIEQYFSIINNPDKLKEKYSDVDESLLNDATKEANTEYISSKNKRQACLKFDLYLLSYM